MSLQYDTATRNAMLDSIATTVGANSRLKIFAGSVPANCAASISGNTLLADMACSAIFAAVASGGILTLNTISDTTASAAGTATFFRFYDSGSTNCRIQGTVGTSGADLLLNSVTISSGEPITITSFTITAPGA